MNRNKTFLVWLNEEDHLRIISIEKGNSLKRAYGRLVKGVNILGESLNFAYHEKFGYLTFSPTNIGTGLEISIRVKLPKLEASKKLMPLCESLNLEARKVERDNGDSMPDGFFDISNLTKVEKSEFEIVTAMFDSIKRLLDEEYFTK